MLRIYIKDKAKKSNSEENKYVCQNSHEDVIQVHGMKAEDVTPHFKESHRPYIKRS